MTSPKIFLEHCFERGVRLFVLKDVHFLFNNFILLGVYKHMKIHKLSLHFEKKKV